MVKWLFEELALFFYRIHLLHGNYRESNLCYNTVSAAEVRQGDKADSVILLAGILLGLDPNLMLADGTCAYPTWRQRCLCSLFPTLTMKVEPRIDDQVMCGPVHNLTSELKGKNDRLFQCKGS